MATFSDLEREVRKLRHRVRQLEGNPDATNEAAVAELTDNSDENMERQSGRHTGGGFVALAEEVREKSIEQSNQVRRRLRGW